MQLHQPHKSEKNIGAFEARRKFGQLIEEAFYQKDAFIIERAGRPMAVLVSVDEYQRFKQLAKDTLFQMLAEVWDRNKDVPAEELEHDVAKAMDMLHAENKQRQLHQK